MRVESRSNPAEGIRIRGTDDLARERFVRGKNLQFILVLKSKGGNALAF
jgi:hypothetical protein